EFGRTTDPVRMYMREMGSVELLTREGEIEIAKRIEDGLKHMIQAISACPTTIAEIIDLAGKVARDEMRIDELVDGLIDPNAKDEPIRELADDVEPEDEEETDGEGESAALSASRQRDQHALGKERDCSRATLEQPAVALRAEHPRATAEAAHDPEADRHSPERPQGHQQADVDGRGEGPPREARNDGSKPAPGDF